MMLHLLQGKKSKNLEKELIGSAHLQLVIVYCLHQ